MTAPAQTRTVRAAQCHPDRPHYCRGLCRADYERAWLRGTLDQHPRSLTRRTTARNLPAGHRSRADFVAGYELLRSEGHTRAQIAERLGMARGAVDNAYRRAVTAGDLTPDRRTT